MQPNQLNDSNTLLTYSLVTTPTPVQVSQSATNQSQAKLTFVVSCPRSVGTATVAQITITVPVDQAGKAPDPTNLAATAPPVSSASISSDGTDQWNVAAGLGPGVFLFTPQTGPVQVSSQSLTIEITGLQVNTLVGTALVRVNEWAVKGTGTPPPVTGPPSGTGSFGVAKFPYGFYAGNLTADRPMVNDLETVTLSWVGSTNATYKMYYGTTFQDVSNVRTWVSPQLGIMTTFILRVSAQVDGQTATIDFSITIEVLNPSLTVNDLTVLTTSTLNGNLTSSASATVAGTVTAGTLASTGNANVTGTVQAGTLTSTGNANVTGTVQAGTVNTGDLHASGNIDVAGAVTCNSMSAGQITVPWQGGQLYLNTALAGFPVAYIGNSVSNPNGVAGIQAPVATPGDIAFWTNGRIVTGSGMAAMTHLPTALGNRVVTSPLSLEAEVHLSGKAKLSQGKADVKFDEGVSDLIVHAANQTYKVLLTPTRICHGLAVTSKSKDGFTVQELHGGTSSATFDWFVIAQKPEGLGATKPHKLPKKLPDHIVAPTPKTNMTRQLSKLSAAADPKTKSKPAAQKKKQKKR